MSIINNPISFHELERNVQNAFSRVAATKELLHAGTSLYRFTGHPRISPWWSETAGLPGLLLAAKSSGKSLSHYIREKSAVLRQWDSDMSNLFIVTLNQPVYAFKGAIAPQNEAAVYMNPADVNNYKKRFTKPVTFGGGNGQVYIHGLTNTQVTVVLPVGTVNVYDDIDHILDFLISYRLV